MQVTVLDGRDVPNPEDTAMLAALYSRDPASVTDHLKKVREVGSGSFIAKYLVGYGHQSIGDCGSTTFYLEGISMLAAKAIQDWPLYSGQEASTRYIDFSTQHLIDPTNTKEGKLIQETWRSLYMEIVGYLKDKLHIPGRTHKGEYTAQERRAINARAFDIARGFLPAGASTMVAWHTNLRQAADHLQELQHHPLHEVRDLAKKILEAAKEKYPSSFGHERSIAAEKYIALCQRKFAYTGVPAHELLETPTLQLDLGNLDITGLTECSRILQDRPRGVNLPRILDTFGQVTMTFNLDFGSFRDFQRHRNGFNRMPILTTSQLHPWYLSNLPEYLEEKAVKTYAEQKVRINDLNLDTLDDNQYYVPMGATVRCQFTGTLRSIVYILDLRSSISVHPTLRAVVQEAAKKLVAAIPSLKLHLDERPGEWDIGRGNQTIVEKDSSS